MSGWAMNCEGFPQKACEHWSYSSNEIISSDPVTGSSQALFNELNNNKENKNTLKAAVRENAWSGFHVRDERHRESNAIAWHHEQ